MTDFYKHLEDLIRGLAHESENKFAAERESFTFPTARPQWAPPRPYDIEQLIMEWKMDLKNERVDAKSQLVLTAIATELERVVLHAADLEIKSVTDGQAESLQWDMDPDTTTMTVYMNRTVKEGEDIKLNFEYVIDHPRGGLHFTSPCAEFPDIETSAWTQMQDDYARYVVPVYDNPSHKFPVEIIVTVPKGYYAMSNGYLKERRENGDGTETFHWVQKEPIPAYLMTVAVSEYVEYKDDLDGLEVSYYVHKKWDRETVYRSFGKTPDMIRFFETKLGVKFPWVKYAQVTAANFIIGGMENASATTQTDATLHDEKAHKDYQSEGLVSHELAHMWGGDLTTCRTWTHGWLNEGWATQMQNEWKRHDLGDDEYLYEQYGKQVAYFEEDKNKYRRPIVQNEWERGSDVFDRHLYPGAAWRYYMLKHLVGEERWWKILGEWLHRYSFQSVYTHDLEALFTEMTGEDYGWFFEQWLYKAGYPECTIKCSYDKDLEYVLVKIEQTQKADDGMTPEVFRFPLTVELVMQNDERVRYTMQVTERVHSFYYPVSEGPKQIIIDPEYAVLMDWKIEKPEPMWIEQLHHGSNVVQRIKAAQALGKKPTPRGIEALGEALVEDPFWGVQAEIAKVLGSIKTESALDQLLRGTGASDTRARTAVATALRQFYRNDRAFDALVKLLNDQDSYFVPSAAAVSIGKIQHDKSFETLGQKIKSPPASWHNLILQGLLNGIVNTEKKEAIEVVKQFMKPGTDDFVRRIVPGALARLGKRYKKEHPEIKEDIVRLLGDRSYRVQVGALLAAKDYGDASLIPDLERIADATVESTLVRYAREAIRALSKKKDKTEIDSIRKSVEELEQQNRDLKDRLSKIETLLEDKTKSKKE